MIFQASSPCQIQAQEQIYALPVPGGCQLKELDLANLNSFGVDYGLAKWHKLTNDFLCSYKGLRIIKIVDSFAVLPLLISGIVNHGETLVLLNVSCGEPVASTLDMLGAGATDFAAALGQVKDKCTSLGSLTCNLDRSIYHGFVCLSLPHM